MTSMTRTGHRVRLGDCVRSTADGLNTSHHVAIHVHAKRQGTSHMRWVLPVHLHKGPRIAQKMAWY